MRILEKIAANVAFGLVVLTLFLSLTSVDLLVPSWLQVLGRMHLLLLHLPIGIWAVLLILAVFTPPQRAPSAAQSFRLLLVLAVLAGAVAAFMGLLLAAEGGYTDAALLNHRRGGIAVAVIGLLFWYAYTYRPMPLSGLRVGTGLILLLITLTGHWGGKLTHGADFVLAPIRSAPEAMPSDTLFAAHIQPILQQKCGSCHNANKQKGELNMATFALMEAGGAHGPIWNVEDPAASPMLQRAALPLADEEHMPPEGKPQLSGAELHLLKSWIEAGASENLLISTLAPQSELAAALAAFSPEPSGPVYDFPAAEAAVVEGLNSPLLRVRPVGPASPALEAKFFIRQNYQADKLKNLQQLTAQLVSLDLSQMPIKDEELGDILAFSQLRTLLLNETDLSGSGIEQLKALENLTKLGLVGIPLSPDQLDELAQLPKLEAMYLWDTGLDSSALEALAQQYPSIHFDAGYQPDQTELLQLSPPIVKGEQAGIYPYGGLLELFSYFPGSEIRYTLDESEPDSLESPVYTQPEIPITDYTLVKARCFLPGWMGSKTASFHLFPDSEYPLEMELLHAPNPKYKRGDATDLFDEIRGNEITFRESFWLGFQDNPLEILVKFDPAEGPISQFAVSYLLQTGSWIFPPSRLEVWAGESPDQMTRLVAERWSAPEDHLPPSIKGEGILLPPYTGAYLKVVIWPLRRLPGWHKGAGNPAHLFVDELFFYRDKAETATLLP